MITDDLMAEQRVDRRAAASHHRVVDGVVVHQRREVNQLGDRGERRRARLRRPIDVAREEQQCRTNHLALRQQQVRVDVRDERIVGGDDAPHLRR